MMWPHLCSRVHSWKSGSYWPCWVNCTTLFQAQQVHTCPTDESADHWLGVSLQMTVCSNLVGVWSCLKSESRLWTETLITRVTACVAGAGHHTATRLRSCSDREQPRHQPVSGQQGPGIWVSEIWVRSVGCRRKLAETPHPEPTHGDLSQWCEMWRVQRTRVYRVNILSCVLMMISR